MISSFFASKNIDNSFTFTVTAATPSYLEATKSSGTAIWNLNNEKVVSSSSIIGAETMNGAGPNYTIKLISDSFEKFSLLHLSNLKGHVDLTKFTQSAAFNISGSKGLTGITNPHSSIPMTSYYADSCNLIGTLDMKSLSGLGGIFYVYSNPNLISITNPNSSEIFTEYNVQTCNLTGTLNLSGLTKLGGVVNVAYNSNLTSIVFPISTQPFIRIAMFNCPGLNYVNLYPLSASTSNDVEINIQNNSWTTSMINHMFYDLDQIGWINGKFFLNGNPPPDSSSGGFDGIASKTNLLGKGWAVGL